VLYYEGVTLPVKRGAKKSASTARPRAKTKVKAKGKTEADRRVRVTEKDPTRMCGKGTGVERVFRVEEKDDKTRVMHLVFFDRHGWYCEHGAQCPAVSDVKKFIRHSR